MNKSAGSYAFDTFAERQKEEELARLKRQATVALALEKRIWQQAGLKAGMNVLDLACGSGVISCEIAKSIDPGEVIGVDLSESMLEQAGKLKEREKIGNLTFQRGSAYELDFPEASFDFVYARLLFLHLADPVKVVKTVCRVLKPGGIFCAVDVDDRWLSVYPEPQSFESFHQSLIIAQQTEGGDPYVGRKLGSYFHQTGLTRVQTRVETISSDQIGLKTLLDLSFGAPYKFPQEELAEIAAKGREDIYALQNLQYAWAGLGMFVATGHKE